MSNRERWIVYPLLFLSLGIALRGKLVGIPSNHFESNELRANDIQCGRLQVEQLQIGRLACRELDVVGAEGRPVVVAGTNPANQSGMIETLSAEGKPLLRLQSTDGGGVLAALGRDGKMVVVGHLDQLFGVFAQVPPQGLLIPLTQPLMHETNNGKPAPKKPDAAESPAQKIERQTTKDPKDSQ